jgi:hypothetical protein
MQQSDMGSHTKLRIMLFQNQSGNKWGFGQGEGVRIKLKGCWNMCLKPTTIVGVSEMLRP